MSKRTSPVGLVRLKFQIGRCGHVASLVWREQGLGVRYARAGNTGVETHVPYEAHNLGLTASKG